MASSSSAVVLPSAINLSTTFRYCPTLNQPTQYSCRASTGGSNVVRRVPDKNRAFSFVACKQSWAAQSRERGFIWPDVMPRQFRLSLLRESAILLQRSVMHSVIVWKWRGFRQHMSQFAASCGVRHGKMYKMLAAKLANHGLRIPLGIGRQAIPHRSLGSLFPHLYQWKVSLLLMISVVAVVKVISLFVRFICDIFNLCHFKPWCKPCQLL